MKERKAIIEKLQIDVPSVVMVVSYDKVKVKVTPIDEIVRNVKT